MLDNQTRRELLSKARQSGFPGSILDVFAAYEQGRDLVGEFVQQQEQQQTQQMSDAAAQQAGMQMPQQMQQPQSQPQQPQGPPPGLPQGSSIPQPVTPNTGLVNSNEMQSTGLASNQTGQVGGKEILATGGFVEKFTEDQYNKFSTHFPFSKEQRGSIAHNATVEHPDLTMVQGKKKYVFGGLKYSVGGFNNGTPNRFNTKLKDEELAAFNQHSQQFPSLINDSPDYDTKGFYQSVYRANNGDINAITKALTPGSPTQHIGTDEFKKPSHPTFSNQSKYSIPVLRPGGEWGHNDEGNYDYFTATGRNIRNMKKSDGTPLEYFKRAEDYDQDGVPDTKLFYKGKSMFATGGFKTLKKRK